MTIWGKITEGNTYNKTVNTTDEFLEPKVMSSRKNWLRTKIFVHKIILVFYTFLLMLELTRVHVKIEGNI